LFSNWTTCETFIGGPPSITYTYLLNPITEWLLKQNAKQELQYILEHNYGGLSSTVLTREDKRLMKEIEDLLN
jgi:hypothetical protein